MKKTIKAICEMEGKKVEVSRANVMEVLRIMADIFNSEDGNVYRKEFINYLNKRYKTKKKKAK